MVNGYDEDSELVDLLAQVRFEKRQRLKLLAHPDCRDPDHPGCEACESDEPDKSEE